MKINKNAMIRSYAQSMGIEAAKDLITKKIKSAALEEKEHYTEEETAKICGELIKEGGLIRIVAQTLLVQLERKRSEEQALLLDNIETQIWYLTDIETYGAVNKAHAEFLGMEKGNLEGESLYDIVGREEVRVCVAGNREVFEKKKQTRTEEWVKNGRGKTRLLSITRTPKIDDNGNVEYVICAAEDITERKKAEEKIKEADIIINKSPAVAFTWKNEEGWPVEYVSENVKKLFGYSTDDFLSRKISYTECVYRDDLERVEQEVADFSKEEEREEFVHEPYRILTKDNNVKVVKDWTFIVRDFEGKITHYKGIIEDITDRKRAEERIEHMNSVLKAIRSVNQMVVVEKDRDSLLQKTCDVLIEARGYDAAWLGFLSDGKTFAMVKGSGFREEVARFSEHVIGGDHPPCIRNALTQKEKLVVVDKSKECEDCFFKSACVGNEAAIIRLEHANRLFGLLAILFAPDVTVDEEEKGLLKEVAGDISFALHDMEMEETRKQAEEALRESEKKLAQAVQGNSIPTFIIDNNHIITHWNKACEILTGFPTAEIVGTQKAWSAFYAEERPVMADFIVDGATEKEIAERYKHISYNKSVLIEGAYEGENFYPDLGEKGKWLFFTAAPLIDQQGKIVGAIETFQDITERRSMEKQLRQSQKMEAIGTLAGGIAHDFNNLLTVIIGNAQLLLMEAGKDESLRKKIEEIEKTGEKAAALTRQLLAFGRKQIIKPNVLDLNEEINETEKMLKRIIREDIEFQAVLGPELWKVYADPGQINQVIINMVVNARDAMPQGGKLTIETANADLVKNYFRERCIKETPGPYVILAISDTGNGMDKETLEHIFEPFFTTKEVGKGTGLGLSTVYGIVKQNNGFIWVYSEPGQGTTFKVYLPKMKGDAEPEEKEQTPVDDVSGSETVLIVEDDDGLRKLAQEVLQSYGYRILAAENGEEALMVGKEHEGPIHLLLTDVVMPKMGGKEAADRLQPLYPQMKVIYMSGYTDNAIIHHGVLAPGLNFLEKPFSPEGLARKVREALDAEKK